MVNPPANENEKANMRDRAMLDFTASLVTDYTPETWETFVNGRKVFLAGQHKAVSKPADYHIVAAHGAAPGSKDSLVMASLDTRSASVHSTTGIGSLGSHHLVMSDMLRDRAGLDQKEYAVFYVMADNAQFDLQSPANPDGKQLDDRDPTHLSVVLTRGAYKKLALHALKSLAVPAIGAAIMHMDEDAYKKAFDTDGRMDRKVKTIVQHAGFDASDKAALEAIRDDAAKYKNTDYAVLMSEAITALPPAADYASEVGRASARRGSGPDR